VEFSNDLFGSKKKRSMIIEFFNELIEYFFDPEKIVQEEWNYLVHLYEE
jgi:hypothetical protein